jgi:hypothetical protein
LVISSQGFFRTKENLGPKVFPAHKTIVPKFYSGAVHDLCGPIKTTAKFVDIVLDNATTDPMTYDPAKSQFSANSGAKGYAYVPSF